MISSRSSFIIKMASKSRGIYAPRSRNSAGHESRFSPARAAALDLALDPDLGPRPPAIVAVAHHDHGQGRSTRATVAGRNEGPDSTPLPDPTNLMTAMPTIATLPPTVASGNPSPPAAHDTGEFRQRYGPPRPPTTARSSAISRRA